MPIVGAGSFRLYGYALASPGSMSDGALIGGDPAYYYVTNTGFFPTTMPCNIALEGPFRLDTTAHGTDLAPGSPPPGFMLNGRPAFTGPNLLPGVTTMSVNNEGTWTMAGKTVSFGVGGHANAEQDDELLLYIELLDFVNIDFTRLDGFPGTFYSFPKSGVVYTGAGIGPSIEGGYSIVYWWWKLPDKDACGRDQVSQLELAPDPPGDGYSKLDPEDLDAHPTPVILVVEPNHGPAAGGTALVITGSGFGQGATVSVGGNAATSVVVVSQYRIECVTPAHAAGSTTVVVTNVDGVHS